MADDKHEGMEQVEVIINMPNFVLLGGYVTDMLLDKTSKGRDRLSFFLSHTKVDYEDGKVYPMNVKTCFHGKQALNYAERIHNGKYVIVQAKLRENTGIGKLKLEAVYLEPGEHVTKPIWIPKKQEEQK